jgi:hypothetical protein
MTVNYMGIYDATGCAVYKSSPHGRKLLPLRLEVRNISPRFTWGMSSAGGQQLAIALLCDALGRDKALEHYAALWLTVIADLPDKDWQMSRDDILAWVERSEAPTREVDELTPEDWDRAE